MVAYKSLKTKEKSSWVIPKVVAVAHGSGRLRELFITKFKSQFKRGFTTVVVTRAGRLREWSQGELRFYREHECSHILIQTPVKVWEILNIRISKTLSNSAKLSPSF